MMITVSYVQNPFLALFESSPVDQRRRKAVHCSSVSFVTDLSTQRTIFPPRMHSCFLFINKTSARHTMTGIVNTCDTDLCTRDFHSSFSFPTTESIWGIAPFDSDRSPTMFRSSHSIPQSSSNEPHTHILSCFSPWPLLHCMT
jgi:hypothetical protein